MLDAQQRHTFSSNFPAREIETVIAQQIYRIYFHIQLWNNTR